MSRGGGDAWLGRVRSLVVIFILCVGAVAPTTRTVAAQEAAPPDLAAMTLVPEDLERAGLPGYGWSNGILTSKPHTVADFSSYWRSDADVALIDSALGAAAPDRVYVLHLLRPTTEGDPSLVEERVVSYVMSFGDESAAAAGYAAWSAAWQAGYASVPTTASVGDERSVVIGEAREADGSPFPLVHVMFRAGLVVAGVSAEFFTGFAPEQETVEELAVRYQERIDAVLDGGAPDLSGRIVYFDAPGVQWTTAMYSVRDGRRLFRDSDTPSSAAESQATATAAGIVDQFQVEQQLGGEPGASAPPLAFYTARIVTFADAGTASRYISDSVARLTEAGASDLTPVSGTATAGEEVFAYTYTHQRDDGVLFNDYRFYARTGSTVFSSRSTARATSTRSRWTPSLRSRRPASPVPRHVRRATRFRPA